MSRNALAWLYAELPELIRKGVLAPDAAEALRRHYGPLDTGGNTRVLRGVLAAFGALLVGGGIILILAHNWDELSRPARAALSMGMLVGAQAVAVYTFTARRASEAWAEVAGAFWVAAVGATIALVSQTYHVETDLQAYYRAWTWLVLPVPYLLGSRVAGLAVFALATARALEFESWHHDWPVDLWASVLIAVPFAWNEIRRRGASWATSLVALAAAIAVVTIGLRVGFDHQWKALAVLFTTATFSGLYGVASLPEAPEGPWRARLRGPAFLALLVTALIYSFDGGAWRPMDLVPSGDRVLGAGGWITLAVALVLLVGATLAALRLAHERAVEDAAWALGGLAGFVGLAFALGGQDAVAAIVMNLWLAAAGFVTLRAGFRGAGFGAANRGLLALAALAAVRFFDSDLDFLVRGLGFVAIGLAFLGVNVWLMRRSREARR